MRNDIFRIKERDTVYATVINKETGKLLASTYNSGFTTIGQVESELLRKIPYTSAKKLDFTITNKDEQTSKCYTKKVNEL